MKLEQAERIKELILKKEELELVLQSIPKIGDMPSIAFVSKDGMLTYVKKDVLGDIHSVVTNGLNDKLTKINSELQSL